MNFNSYLAAKTQYFGVGGNLRQFEKLIADQKMWTIQTCFCSEEGATLKNFAYSWVNTKKKYSICRSPERNNQNIKIWLTEQFMYLFSSSQKFIMEMKVNKYFILQCDSFTIS